MSTTGIKVERAGRRSYIIGNTYPIKDALKAAGAHWDGDRRAWWLGDDAAARSLVERCGQATCAPQAQRPQGQDGVTEDTKIAGKATYKGRPYLLLWMGQTSRGEAAKLAFSDGSKVFWADAAAVQVTKTYERHETKGPMTWRRLQVLRARYAEGRAQGYDDGIAEGRRYECPECGEYVTRGVGSCWETGCAH